MALPSTPRPTTGRARRLAREDDARRGVRRPGDPRVVVSADEARALDEAARDQRRQAAARAGRPTAVEVLGGRPGVPLGRVRAGALFDATPAQRPGRAAGPRGRTRYGWRRDQAAADAVLAPTVAAFRARALEAVPA